MLNIIAAIMVFGAYLTFGIWLCDRKWRYTNDLDIGFFVAWLPLAIVVWIALYLVGA